MKESPAKVIDQSRFEVTFGDSNQDAIFDIIAKHIKYTGDTVETIELSTGAERYQAKVVFYTDDISRLPPLS